MSITTTELINRLKQADDINKFINDYESEYTSVSYVGFLNELLENKNLTLVSVVKNSGQSDYVYKIFRGERKPSRDIVISIAVGMTLSVEETQFLLRISKLAQLDPRDKRDSIIIYGLKEEHNINKINELLFDLNETTL